MTPGMDQYERRQYNSITELTQIARCPRKAFYQVGCRLSRALSPAMEFGTAIHAAIPQILTGDLKDRLQRSLDEFGKCWDGTLDDEKRNANQAKQIIMNFAITSQPYELIHPSELPGMSAVKMEVQDKVSDYEVVFALDIGNKVPLVGRIDGIGREKATGKLKIIEFKTTSQLWGFPEMFQLSPQTIGYHTVANMLLPTLGIDGVYVHAISVPKPAVRVATKYENQVVPISVAPHHQEAWLSWARFWSGFWTQCEEQQEFPQWFTGCHPYSMFGSHGFQCEFIDLCFPTPDWTQMSGLFQRSAPRYVQLTKNSEVLSDSVPKAQVPNG